MPNWTPEQRLAIEKDGQNIIVSAGAGSGKTAVLSERVIRKLEQGADIDHLLILTFTKAAAFEMMIRIRDKIKERPVLKEQLDKIDSAYITTFDAFALSIVKKYYYILGIQKDIQLVNPNIIQIEKKKCLDKIFETYYESRNPSFLKLLEKYTLKDDCEIKKLILRIESQLDLKYDKQKFLKTYIDKNFQKEEILRKIEQFEAFVLQKISIIKEQLYILLDCVDEDYGRELKNNFELLLSSKTYEEVFNHIDIPKKNLPKDSSEEAKKAKEDLSKSLKELQELLIYQDKQEIEKLFKDTQESIRMIIEIIQEFDWQMTAYKKNHAAYEFTDIFKMAIWLVKENSEINQELKEHFEEIMIDEYQDTSDLQEIFIQMIAHDNVYMVGDIKQSIYRFRNANPYLFKEKYDSYGKQLGGFKIDLIKNFRSRKEVLENINFIFNYIMDDFVGGCNYKKEHQMVFGNLMYEKNIVLSQNSNMEIYHYSFDRDSNFSKDEIEAFLIAKDIKRKIQNHYQVIDKETSSLRNCNYSDFTILIDTSKNFELYNKIFEYLHIPLAVYKDTSITKEDDIYILSNLLKFIYCSYYKLYNKDFRYAFLSVSRSYFIDDDDETIFLTVKNDHYLDSNLMKKISPILEEYSKLNGVTLIEKIIDSFDLYERQIQVGNMEHFTARMSYIKTLFEEMGTLGYSLDEMIQNFNQMVDDGYEIKVTFTKNEENAVKIMTIHKSKGLEFPILYMAGLSNRFNIRELNEKFIYDQNFGIMIPFYGNQEITHILKPLIKDSYIKEEISEKIRLFYVALTRAKEKIILVTPNHQEDIINGDPISLQTKYQYRSFLDILRSIWNNLDLYKKEIDVEELKLTKNYNFIQIQNNQDDFIHNQEKIVYQEVKVDNKIIDEKHYSKTMTSLLTEEECHSLELGKRFHSIFENLDFKNPNFSLLSEFEKDYVKAFLNLEILKDLEKAEIYKEYEFVLDKNGEKRHGVIDLLIEYHDKIQIIDYKLKQVEDIAYVKQLQGYKAYIEEKISKPIELYLYSILEKKLKQL